MAAGASPSRGVNAEGHHVSRPIVQADGGEAGLRHLSFRAARRSTSRSTASCARCRPQPMDVDTVRRIAYELMNKEQAREFENDAGNEPVASRPQRSATSAINIFRQRGTISLVIRYVRSNVPPFEQLQLPPVLLDLVHGKARPRAGRRRDRLRQVDHARRDDRSPQLATARPHPDRSRTRSSTCSSTSRASSTSAKSASTRSQLHGGAAERAARGARPHHDRRSARQARRCSRRCCTR